MIKIKILHLSDYEIFTIWFHGSLGAARIAARKWCNDYLGSGNVAIDYILPAGGDYGN